MELTKQAQDYAIRVAELVKFLREDDKGFPLADELLACGVEAGLSLREPGTEGFKKAAGALRKSDYLLEMAVSAGYLTERQSVHIRDEGRALLEAIDDKKQIEILSTQRREKT